jgi:hypothetical protein
MSRRVFMTVWRIDYCLLFLNYSSGERVYVTPCALIALARKCNTIDLTRLSPSYEYRLAKYAARGVEIELPGLDRSLIDDVVSVSITLSFR